MGSLLDHLHTRLSVRGDTGGGVSLVAAAPQGIPFVQLPLVPFFVYESSRSVQETARFRLTGVAVVEFLSALEQRQRSSLHLGGGPYSHMLGYPCTHNGQRVPVWLDG